MSATATCLFPPGTPVRVRFDAVEGWLDGVVVDAPSWAQNIDHSGFVFVRIPATASPFHPGERVFREAQLGKWNPELRA